MDLRKLTNEELVRRLDALVSRERDTTADLVAHVAEVDRRGIAVDLGYPSLYMYLVHHHRYPEGSAFRLFRAGRAARFHSSVLTLLRDGQLNVPTAALVQPYLRKHGEDLLDRAKGKSMRQVEALLAQLDPARQVPDSVRVINAAPPPVPSEPPGLPLSAPQAPASSGAGPDASAGAPPPLAPADPAAAGEAAPGAESAPVPGGILKVRFSFTADSELWSLVRRAREILRHKYPGGRLEAIFKDALKALLDKRDPDRRLLAAPPRPARPLSPQAATNRPIPQSVKDIVWKRDAGACAFVGELGRRCGETAYLEYDHVAPFALGGRSDDPANVRLLCRAHNRLMAQRHGLTPSEETA